MQEIAPHVFVETAYPGVTLGAINWQHGLILIDAPLRAEDARLWRSSMLNMGGGIDRLVVNLDANYDRTLGVRALECTIIGHEKINQAYRSRPVTFKAGSGETGSDWEVYNNLGSIRWAPPEITFTEEMQLHWDDRSSLHLEYHPGPATGASWAILPDQGILFVGDAVIADAPPFLAQADLPAWQEALRYLLSPQFQNYLLVGGRNGLLTHNHARLMLDFLVEVHQKMEELAERKAQPDETTALVEPLLSRFRFPEEKLTQYTNRLRHGLHQYYLRHYRPSSTDIEE